VDEISLFADQISKNLINGFQQDSVVEDVEHNSDLSTEFVRFLTVSGLKNFQARENYKVLLTFASA
jgi:hypothetical protein